jgi:hypothetical protein
MFDQPTAHSALKKLEPLLGRWALEVTSAVGEGWPGEARPSFQCHDSGTHLVARSLRALTRRPTLRDRIGRAEDRARTDDPVAAGSR